jgi:hypothetical protein
MKTTTTETKPTDEQIDDYIAAQYMAQTRGEETGSFIGRLMALAEEARVVDPKGKEILLRQLRELAAWELEQA